MEWATRRTLAFAVWVAVAAVGWAQEPGGKDKKGGGPPPVVKKPPARKPVLPVMPIPIAAPDPVAKAQLDGARTARLAPPPAAARKLVRKLFADFNDRANADPVKLRTEFLQREVLGDRGAYGDALSLALVEQAPDFLFGPVAELAAIQTQINVLCTLIDMDLAVRTGGNAAAGKASGAQVYADAIARATELEPAVVAVAISGLLTAKQLGISTVEQERSAAAGAMRFAQDPVKSRDLTEELVKLFGEVGRQGSTANADSTDIGDYLGAAILDQNLTPRTRLLASIALAKLRPRDFAARNWLGETQMHLVAVGLADGVDFAEAGKAGGAQGLSDAKYYGAHIAMALAVLQEQANGGPGQDLAAELVKAAKGAAFDLYDGKKAESKELRVFAAAHAPMPLRLNPKSSVIKARAAVRPPEPEPEPKAVPKADAAK